MATPVNADTTREESDAKSTSVITTGGESDSKSAIETPIESSSPVMKSKKAGAETTADATASVKDLKPRFMRPQPSTTADRNIE